MDLRLIFWETTRACNLECPHCRASAENDRSALELSPAQAKRFIEQCASFSRPILVFSGGEPLLREDIYELARFAAESGLKSALATNSTLISEDIAKRLKESRIKIVAVSVYGANMQTHDRFCGKVGAFEKTLKGIKNLRNAGINFQINTTITKKNLNELEAMGDFALKQGAVAYHVFFLVPTGRGKSIEGDEISAREYEGAFNRVYDLQLNSPLRIKVTCAPHYYRVLHQRFAKDKSHLGFKPVDIGHDDSGAAQRFEPIGDSSMLRKGCLAGRNVCFISHRGEVFGCGYLSVKAGDLTQQDFKSIWFESEVFKILRDDSKLQGKCANCEFKIVCGGCRARAYAATGDYLEEEPNCAYQPLTVRS